MEGPTPVPALIHAATMVTAGIFLIIRCSYIFEFSYIASIIMVYLGSFTIVIFGLIGLFQYDLKKIIAFSTCSQLGYMVLACGLSAYQLALFHLFNHAGFKALLFLAAGSIIHIMNNEQDIRKLNGFFYINPTISIFFIIANLSLIGLPFFSGSYSKDAIINSSAWYLNNPVIYLSTLVGVLLTTMYSLKIFYFLFIKSNFNNSINSNYKIIKHYKTNIYNIFPL
jgi:NADH-ubiquinone oxidoreductase chain 5